MIEKITNYSIDCKLEELKELGKVGNIKATIDWIIMIKVNELIEVINKQEEKIEELASFIV